MNEYRCTRVLPYVDHNCYGQDDPEARQGYYVAAEDVGGAYSKMASEFPDDVKECSRRKIRPFTIKLHKCYGVINGADVAKQEVMAP